MTDSFSHATAQEIEKFFWAMFDLLTDNYKNVMRDWWKSHNIGTAGVTIDRNCFVGAVDIAGTDSFSFSFDLQRIRELDLSLVRVVYHELAHCYYIAIGKHSLLDAFKKRDQQESDVRKLEKKFISILKTDHHKRLPSLRVDSLISELSLKYNLFPIFLGTNEIDPIQRV